MLKITIITLLTFILALGIVAVPVSFLETESVAEAKRAIIEMREPAAVEVDILETRSPVRFVCKFY